MKHVRWTWVAGLAAVSVGCVAHIDSSALSKSDGGGDPATAAADDDAGSPITAMRDAARPPPPPVRMEDDDAGSPPVIARPVSGAGGSAPKPDAQPACDFRGLVQLKCGNMACHGAPAANTGLDLTSASLATRVEGRKGPSGCANNLLIDKANPANSALYLKITGTKCGSQMPLGGTLTASEQACVLSWIEQL